MSTANIEIRDKAKRSGVKFWMVAEKLGVSESVFSRKLRHELKADERAQVLAVIEELAAGAGEVA